MRIGEGAALGTNNVIPTQQNEGQALCAESKHCAAGHRNGFGTVSPVFLSRDFVDSPGSPQVPEK